MSFVGHRKLNGLMIGGAVTPYLISTVGVRYTSFNKSAKVIIVLGFFELCLVKIKSKVYMINLSARNSIQGILIICRNNEYNVKLKKYNN
jgi:hypothetical protein